MILIIYIEMFTKATKLIHIMGDNNLLNIDIRKCDEKDLLEILDLMNELVEFTDSPFNFSIKSLKENFIEMGKGPQIYKNYVAVNDGKVIGFISIILYKTLFHRGGTALINELIINKNHRDKGIGRILINKAKEVAIAKGIDEMEVGTSIKNMPAHMFYKKCGFSEEYLLLGMEFTNI